MHRFLSNHRDELIERCKAKVAQRPRRAATAAQLANGIPMFLDQLTRTLQAQESGEVDESLRISGAAGGDAAALSEMGLSAAAHGKQLLELGYSVDQGGARLWRPLPSHHRPRRRVRCTFLRRRVPVEQNESGTPAQANVSLRLFGTTLPAAMPHPASRRAVREANLPHWRRSAWLRRKCVTRNSQPQSLPIPCPTQVPLASQRCVACRPGFF